MAAWPLPFACATGAAAVSAIAACATAVIEAARDRRTGQPLLMAHATLWVPQHRRMH